MQLSAGRFRLRSGYCDTGRQCFPLRSAQSSQSRRHNRCLARDGAAFWGTVFHAVSSQFGGWYVSAGRTGVTQDPAGQQSLTKKTVGEECDVHASPFSHSKRFERLAEIY
ncbi:unnamed protein product [Symbiodinium microadriaticum]|nr:unnamed protein product [Symbiodinium sp. KB8]CAE7757622.1 unnamed protein product [Symbiodinium microadriaticum]